jgi:hypothetical protein
VTSVRAEFSTGGSFAAPGYGARAWGMGGATVAFGSDEGAIFWNPALLSQLDNNRLGLSYVDLIPGTDAQQSYLAYAHILKRGVPDEPSLQFARHSVGALYGNLRLELSDGQKYNENMLRLAYAYSPEYFITFAASFNVLLTSSDVESFGGSGSSFDIGFRMVMTKHMTLGLVLRNAASQLEFDDGTNYSLPRSLTLGIAYRLLQHTTVEGDAVAKFGSISKFVVGAESWLFSGVLALRGGVSAMTAGENRNIPHLGIGVRLQRLSVDYNADFDNEESFEDRHRFSLGIAL